MSIKSPQFSIFFRRSAAQLCSSASLPTQLTSKLRHFQTVLRNDQLFLIVPSIKARKFVLVGGILGPIMRSNILQSLPNAIIQLMGINNNHNHPVNLVPLWQNQTGFVYKYHHTAKYNNTRMIPEPEPEHQLRPQVPASVKISIDRLENEFQCTICLNPISDAYITRCGHVFCKVCIQQAVGRHHRCPFCTQEIKEFKTDVFKNYHFNTIKKIVEDEKRSQTDKYLGKVFATDKKSKIQAEEAQVQDLLLQIQKKVVQNCQSALLQYRKFMITLYYLQKEAEQKKALHGSKVIRDQKTIRKEINDFMLESFPNPVISPEIIQKSTHIYVLLPGNKVNKNTIKIAPMATFEVLLPYIDKICSENNLMLKGTIPDVLTINGVPRSMKERIGTLAGSTIKIEKGIPFEEKVYCFTYNWDKQKTCAYYICKTCNTKWICQNCALHCHQGHQYQMQIKEHKSDWAMCYCVTKCQCKALNKNSMESS